MDKATRSKLLRQRFIALGGVIPPKSEPQPRPKTMPLPPNHSTKGKPFFGVSLYEKRCKWVSEPDAVPRVAPKPDRRRKGDAALNRIAAKWRSKPLS